MTQTLATSAFLLDTNILVHLCRGKSVGQAIAAAFGLLVGLHRCVISVVTVGEMNALARKWAWGSKKVADLEALLEQIVWTDINHPDILDAYGEIDDISRRAGRTMGKNDVWIAATAKVAGVTLLTTDDDFSHLQPVHLSRIRIDENTGLMLP